MDENRFEDLMRGLPREFNQPPAPPLDEMWSVIEDAHFNAQTSTPSRPKARALAPWLAAAATLVIGIGIGRYTSFGLDQSTVTQTSVATAAPLPQKAADTSAVAEAYRDQTSRYLGQAAALLISLPSRETGVKTDAIFARKAGDLLVTTRLLIDSPAAQDPNLRSLLEDLELVLVQIARLHNERNRRDLDLIHQAVEQGDVLSRLNSAVVNNQSSE
jgi:hypothetical protein